MSIWNGNIHTKGAKALAHALSKNISIEKLRLSSNSIGDDGATAFADVLMNNNKTQLCMWCSTTLVPQELKH